MSVIVGRKYDAAVRDLSFGKFESDEPCLNAESSIGVIETYSYSEKHGCRLVGMASGLQVVEDESSEENT